MDAAADPALHDIVSALAYTLAAERGDAAIPALAPPYNDLAQFVLRQHARMSAHVRVPLAVLTRAFDALALARHGQRFRHLGPEPRARMVAAWRGSPLAPQRDFIRFYDSLVTLALHSRPIAVAPAWSASPPDSRPEAGGTLRCEIAVIGSGPGGSITACLLAEAGRDVLLIEEGANLPLEATRAFSLEEMERKYRNGGLTVALGKTNIAYVEGRTVGGGSEINSGLYHRTPPDVLEAWRREFDVAALTEAELRPHFEACERDVSVSPLAGPAPAASLKLHDGATRLGWKSLEVPRWFKPAPGVPGGGHRQSMTRTFVPRFLAAGGRLLADTRVTRLRRDGATWQLHAERGEAAPAVAGSRATAGRMPARALRIAAENVFVCGGAVQTPALLQRSGITRNIGRSFRLHPTVKLVARFPEVINAADMGVPVHQVKEFAPRLSFGCSISSPPYLALGLIDHAAAARAVPHDWPHLAIYYAMITGEGSGSVRALPGCRDPLVRYALTTQDRRDLADGLKKLAEAMFAAGAEAIYPNAHGAPILRARADTGKLAAELPAGASGLMTIHLFSSCPMGERRERAAADSFGRVHDVPGLYISDASLLCGAPGVNPQGTIMALARRNALRFLGRD
jgi:choline dehydrogenase-like flavoprotein